MELIINEGIMQETKSFIQQHINKELLSKSTQDMFIFLYNTITPENANEYFNKVNSIYQQEVFKMKMDISMGIWEYAVPIFIFSSIVNIGSYIVSKYQPYIEVESIQTGSAIMMGLSGIAIFAAVFA